MNTILIVEDDMSLNMGIMLTLQQENLQIRQAFDLKTAKHILCEEKINLIILDINLPDGSGLTFCAELRQTSQVPIMFLTANDMETDIVLGFESGGDDYITKPFSLMVLRVRVMAILKRADKKTDNRYLIDHMAFDFEKIEFFVSGHSISLSKTEQKLLKKLLVNQGIILTREQLINSIWGHSGEFVDENALTVTMKRLRSKIEKNPSDPHYLKTVYGLGYVWKAGGRE